MITVDEAVDIATGRGRQGPLEPVVLDEEDQMRLDYIDATIEAGIYKGFNGEIFTFNLPVEYEGGVLGTRGVIHEIKRRYEEGGWSVAIVPRLAGDRVVEWQIVFAPTRRLTVSGAVPKTKKLAPVSALAVEPQLLLGRRLLLRMPTRGRPVQAIEVLQKYREMAGMQVTIEVVIDEDDASMLDSAVLQRLAALDCVVTVGAHKSKVEACNGGTLGEWDVIALISDDMVPVKEGYAARMVDALLARWPHLDGAVYFDDGHQHGMLCTLPVMGRRFYEQHGCIYSPKYKSLYCDREQTDLWKLMGRLAYVDEKIIEHRHHLWGQAPVDALYARNDAQGAVDKATHERRRGTKRAHAQWGFDSPPLWLSILICSLPERRGQLDHLLGGLWRQILRRNERRDLYGESPVPIFDPSATDALEVEVLVDDREGVTIGEKRQALLERSRGHFVAHIDDDDGIAHDYVDRVVDALREHPDVDCASLVGAMTTDGHRLERFEHSLKYEKWEPRDGVHVRSPNHLNAVRRDLALQVGFSPRSSGEDFEFSTKLRPLLRTEATTGTAPIYFYWFMSK